MSKEKSEKKVKRVVLHPRYYQRVTPEGEQRPRMVPVEVGSVVEVTKAQAEKAGNKLGPLKSTKVLKGGQLVDQSPASGDGARVAELEAEVKDLKKALKDATPEKMQAALTAMQKQLDDALAENEELKGAAKK